MVPKTFFTVLIALVAFAIALPASSSFDSGNSIELSRSPSSEPLEQSRNPSHVLAKREPDYVLVCTRRSFLNARQCWDRFQTFCRNDGYMENECNFLTQGHKQCHRDVCYCQRNSRAVLPGFFDPFGGFYQLDDGYVRGSSDSGESWGKGHLVATAQENPTIPGGLVSGSSGNSTPAADNEASPASFAAEIEKRDGLGNDQHSGVDDVASEGNTYHTAKYLADLAVSKSGNH